MASFMKSWWRKGIRISIFRQRKKENKGKTFPCLRWIQWPMLGSRERLDRSRLPIPFLTQSNITINRPDGISRARLYMPLDKLVRLMFKVPPAEVVKVVTVV